MQAFWHDFLYTPLLNTLIFLYTGPAFGNLGLAVIELTVLLRIALLPFTVVDERNHFRYEALNKKIEVIDRDFKTDHVMRAERIRDLLKQQKVSYWSKVFVLGTQLLVLVLLYQVFIGGIRFTPSEVLYSWVQTPPKVNTIFFGFDLAAKSLGWASAVGIILFLEIYTEQKQREHLIRRSDVMYLFLFPIFSVVVLLMLPMVKSLFVLTSMFFTMFIVVVRRVFFRVPAVTAHEK